jgi:hypothetical protein
MRGGWNELQALVLNDFPYTYYIHCFAHILQLVISGVIKRSYLCLSIFYQFEFYC